MENNNSQENKTVIEYLGGKRIVLIVAGSIMAMFLIASIITAVTKPRTTVIETTVTTAVVTTIAEETTVQTTVETSVETEITESSEPIESIDETEGSTEISAESEQEETEQTDSDGPATIGQINAEAAAELYLSVMPFSERDLREQLEFDGYDSSEIDYAIENCGADWNEQAASMARFYSIGVLSRSDMIEFLEEDGFTPEQAEYGANAAGY